MKVHLLFSGPIRQASQRNLYTPGIDSVKFVLDAYKKQLEGYDIVTYMSTWNNNIVLPVPNIKMSSDLQNDTETLKKLFDHVVINEEPTDDHIYRNLTERTQQQRQLHGTPNNIDNWTLGIYKMFMGTTHLIDYIRENGLIAEDEIAIRIRMDSIFEISNQHWNDIFGRVLKSPNKYYVNFVCGTANYSDWFGVSMYRNIRRIWHFSSMEELNFFVKNNQCSETLINNKATANRIESVNIKTELSTIPNNYIVRHYVNSGTFKKHYYE